MVSGGLDSAVLLRFMQLTNRGGPDDVVEAVTFDYGQRHLTELKAAQAICDWAEVTQYIVEAKMFFGDSCLDPAAVTLPQQCYTEDNMKLTVVPNRNMILLALAGGLALSRGLTGLAYAAHAGDHSVYPDCRPEFIQAMQTAFKLSHYDGGLELYTPFSRKQKWEVVRLGAEIRVPFKLTYSCYAGGELHCGVCATCRERKNAFEVAGVVDPTSYMVTEPPTGEVK